LVVVGSVICSAIPTLSKFFEAVYLPLRMVRASDGTIENYRQALKHWRSICGDQQISDIDSLALATFQRGLASRSPATVNGYTRPILAMLRLATDEEYGLLDRMPRVRFLKEPRRSPLALTLDEFRQVLSSVQQVRTPVAGCSGGVW
jgi:integrase